MLKIAIDVGYIEKFEGIDKYGVRVFMRNFFLENGIDLVRVSLNKFDEKKKVFNEYNIFDSNGNNIIFYKPYKPDIVWIRSGGGIKYKYEKLKPFIVTPSEKIAILGRDKFEQFRFFQKYQPYTAILSSFFGENIIQKKFKKKIVLKPIRSNGGKGIILTDSKNLLKNKKKYDGLEDLYIVQEFKNFSKGYPGITKGTHDIRLMFLGDKILEISCRLPKKGEFKSNISAGGDILALKKKQIPKELFSLSKKIYKSLNLDGKDIFSMDFAYCSNDKRRYLIELNSSPGTRTSWYRDKKVLENICKGFVGFFKKISKKD